MIKIIVVSVIVVATAFAATMMLAKTFALTTGVDAVQIDSYTKAVDEANKIKNKVENQRPVLDLLTKP